MDKQIIPFEFEGHAVRVVMIDGDPWWVAGDLAKLLGYRHAPHMVRMLKDHEKGVHLVDTLRGRQEMSIVAESGMWKAVFRSKQPGAERIVDWVASEVLPSIRRTGKYVLYEPPAAPEVALDLDVPRINASVALVREGRRLFGPRTARELWVRMGLPVSITEAQAVQLGDTLAEPLRAWLIGRTVCTTHGAAQAMGIQNPTPSDKFRIAAILRAYGWMPKAQRIDGKKENAWNSPTGNSWSGVVAGEAGL